MEQTEVYAPKSLQLWNTVLNWLTFVAQIVVQIVRSTPSMAQVFSFVGFSDGSFLPSSSSTGFKPLPVVEIPVRSSSVGIDGGISSEIDTEAGNFRKLTVVLDLDETLVSAYETSSLPPSLCIKATEAGLKWFELECVSSDKFLNVWDCMNS